jgi:1-aminocyclopropane-1-carboxylate deaminase/D-cysteine desulfhydrase-like pyridoxal-dependent ACC family enzyme
MISNPAVVAQKIRGALGPCSLGAWPTPLVPAAGLAEPAGVNELWVKREDRVGGSKVRGLEFLLAGALPGTAFVTIGGTGSTHCLATATHAPRVGGCAVLAQFPQPFTAGAYAVGLACVERAAAVVRSRTLFTFPFALLAAWRRAGTLGPRRWIPGGGADPRAVVGHFLAGLELADQIPAPPDAIVAPLGSTGTVAGLSLAVRALGWPTRVVGVRVAPRMVANAGRAMRLARGAQRVLQSAGVDVPEAHAPLVVNGIGTGYGYPTVAGERAFAMASPHGLILDSTYSAKTFAALAAVGSRGFRRVVFWHTFALPGVATEEIRA